MADTDRGYVSQYSQETVGMSILVGGNPTDADAAVTVTILNQDTQANLLIATAQHTGTGDYQITLTPDDTAVLGNYQATWAYTLGGNQQSFLTFFSIGGAEPAYDALTSDMKALVDSVWIRIADIFDSPSGGPNLLTWAQANFNRGRIAQLMKIALGRLNTMAQPYATYTLDGVGGSQFPTAQWGPLLEQATWVETVKHLRRSYLEQPEWQGSSISRLDRQAYFDRWGAILDEEQENLRPQLDVFKISQMGLGRPSILVSGGAFGRYSSVNRPYLAARPRLWFANYMG